MASSVQGWLVKLGCTQTLYPSSLGRIRTTATWTPAANWNGSDVRGSFEARYGFINVGIPGDGSGIPESELHLYAAGNYAEERGIPSPFPGQSPFLGVMRELTGDPSLILSYQDLEDLKVVKDPQANDVIFNSRVAPKIAEAAGAAAPPPAAPPVIVQPSAPVAPPPVLPAPPPTSEPSAPVSPPATPPATFDFQALLKALLASLEPLAISAAESAAEAAVARVLPKPTPAPPAPPVPKPKKPRGGKGR